MTEEEQQKISGALFDFMGCLTTRSEELKLGANHESTPIVSVFEEWAKKRNLKIGEADVKNWNK